MKECGIWLILIILAFGLGANVGCHSYSNDSGQKGPALEPILGALDLPARGSKLRETGIVGGWAVAESGVKRIAIYIDRQFVRFANIDGKRPDIAKLFGKEFPGAEMSGWTFMLDVSKMADGDHEMVAQVETNRGAVREFGPVPFQVVH
jgi:hypothetical protein